MTGTDQVSNVGVDRESIVGSVDKEVEPLTNVFLNTNQRYYDCQYRVRGGGNFKVVRRAAQSLCLLLTANETKEN